MGKKFTVLVLGSGKMGLAAIEQLVKDEEIEQVIVNDLNQEVLQEIESRWGKEKLTTESIDVTDIEKLIPLMKRAQVGLIALPKGFELPVIKAGIQAGLSLVDLASPPEVVEDRFTGDESKYHRPAIENKMVYIPSCGVAPGLSNILVMYGINQLDRAEKAFIKVGGIPQDPVPPFQYKLVFGSVENVLKMYSRTPRVVRDGELVDDIPISGLETVYFPGIGQLECALTDGLASLIYTVKNLEEMDEKTIRYPGHYEKIQAYIDCGFLNEEPVEVAGQKISPRSFLAAQLTPHFKLEKGERDLTVMRVDVLGEKNDRRCQLVFELMDFYDETNQVTSMARTTAYTGMIVAKMIARGEIKEQGVIMPEEAVDPETLLKELAKMGIEVTRKEIPL